MRALITYLLSLSVLPAALSAQPVMNRSEYYHIGDVIKMINCDPSTVTAGPAGANVIWDFTALIASGGISTTQVLNDTSLLFSTSNIMEIMPDGTVLFLNENNTDSYIDGMYNPGTNVTTFYSLYDDSRRPLTYNTVFVDSYRVNIPSTTYGTGRVTEVGDAYGTLMLPGMTFDNVLRIRKVHTEDDTTGSSFSTEAIISYLWFDTAHAQPLLRIDSVTSQFTTSQSVRYILPSTGLTNLATAQVAYSGFLDNNEHLFVNGFETAKVYQVTLYNIIGNKIYTESFTAAGYQQRFEIGRQLTPGIYMVSIISGSDPYGTSVVKLVKQE